MTSLKTLRRWPTHDFLAELEPSTEDPSYPFDGFFRREAEVRRLRRRLQVASGALWKEIDVASRTTVEDLRSDLESAIFKAAFNLGFEHGMISERTAGRIGRRQAKAAQKRFCLSVQQLLAENDLSTQGAAAALLDFCGALVRGPRPTAAGTRRRVSRPSP
jgi:hypothetical protein